MAILTYQSIKAIPDLITPMHERTVAHGMTYGLGPSGYDLRLAEDLILPPKTQVNSFAIERIKIPGNLRAKIENKSTLARMGIDASATTNAEPGWEGWLTLEIYNRGWWFKRLRKGMPIVQIVFEELDAFTEAPYTGRYQRQPPRTVNAILVR